ncbi:Chorion peroxidase like protein [Argiope bruennichi]|uniref:Chorion peroxidase like protein n=1 Tax=Argiope bruennichi TaxID=94029 RepID=A0A8T0EWL4_ARGBR|nr:Chorion peroxidase like protein [Argiope bruennichi]KAF8782736.1 Chorion peroxidase like protein [Argiope bruennichi]
MLLSVIFFVTILFSVLQSSRVHDHLRVRRQSPSEETPVIFPDLEVMPENQCIAYDGGVGLCRPAGLCVFRFDTVKNLEGGRHVQWITERSEFAVQVSHHRQGSLLTSTQSREGLRHLSLANTVIADTCPKNSPCPTTKYRTSDGSCNNLRHPEWGKAFHTYARVVPPRYADARGALPKCKGGFSQRAFASENRPSRKVTVAFALWAQFLAYDLSLTGVTIAGNGDGILCCHPEIQKNPRLLHPACMPIHILDDDPYFHKFGRSCMHFLRSIAAPRSDCTFGPREQLNQVTAYIDGSSIYGSSEERTKVLRSYEGGKLKWSIAGGEDMLPANKSLPCASKDSPCFASGDKRSNQNALLTLIHDEILFQVISVLSEALLTLVSMWCYRLKYFFGHKRSNQNALLIYLMCDAKGETNRLADRLSRLNAVWNDEILFREARRLLCAQLQHITYTEFLPLLLGNKVMSSYGLSPKLSGFSFDYNADLNAAIINSFATAANRFGHTLVQEDIEMYSSQGARHDESTLQKFDPSLLHRKDSFDALVRGTLRQPAQAFDSHVSNQLKNQLFNDSGYGLDIIALNIQRGRDHGLPGYNEWREYCGLPRLRNFKELENIMEPTVAKNFSRLYGNVDDVDLYPAGIAENPLPDAILGPTFACIVAEQFRRLKLGDRFWYENGGMESSFSEVQLQEIRKVTLSRLLCDNSHVESIQLVAFVKQAGWNPTENCKDGKIPRMNLAPWKNEPVWT